MRQTTFQPIILFSVNQVNLTQQENEVNTKTVERTLKDMEFSFSNVEGSYKGNKEKGFLVVVNDYTDITNIESLAKTYNQESILLSGKDRKSQLVYMDGSTSAQLGTLRNVPKTVALKKDSYTEVLINGRKEYFTCN